MYVHCREVVHSSKCPLSEVPLLLASKCTTTNTLCKIPYAEWVQPRAFVLLASKSREGQANQGAKSCIECQKRGLIKKRTL